MNILINIPAFTFLNELHVIMANYFLKYLKVRHPDITDADDFMRFRCSDTRIELVECAYEWAVFSIRFFTISSMCHYFSKANKCMNFEVWYPK